MKSGASTSNCATDARGGGVKRVSRDPSLIKRSCARRFPLSPHLLVRVSRICRTRCFPSCRIATRKSRGENFRHSRSLFRTSQIYYFYTSENHVDKSRIENTSFSCFYRKKTIFILLLLEKIPFFFKSYINKIHKYTRVRYYQLRCDVISRQT